MYLAGDAPFPAEYGFMPLGEVLREPPAGRRRSRPARARLRERAPDRARSPPCSAMPRSSSTSTTTTTTRGSAPSTSSSRTPRRRPRSSPTCSPRSTRRFRRRSPRRSTSALVTDTGRFQYANTTPKALRLAADLVEAGANVHDIFRHVYETVQFAKLKLLARALEHARAFEDGRLVDLVPPALRFRRGRGRGAVLGGDHRLPARERGLGARRPDPRAAAAPAGRRIASRFAPAPTRSTSRRSPASRAAAAIVQAAGFSSELPLEEIVEFVHREFVAAAGAEG